MSSTTRTLVAVAIVAVVVVSSAGIAAGQTGQTTTPVANGTNTSAGQQNASAPTTAEPNSGAGATDGGGGGGMFGGFDISLYEPENPVCEGGSSPTALACDSTMSTLLNIGQGFMELYADVVTGVIEFIVDRPRAQTADGGLALVTPPANTPMDTVYDIWRNKVLPLSLYLWAVFAMLNVCVGIGPMTSPSPYAQRQANTKTVLSLGRIILAWAVGQLALWLSYIMSIILAPSRSDLVANPQAAQADTAGAVIGALFIYFGYGVVAALALAQVAITFVAIFVLLPSLSLGEALRMPEFWLFDRLQSVGDRVRSLFVPCAFWPVPTAAILGVGYPITGAIAEAQPDALAFIPGVAAGVAGTLGLLRLGVWFCALLAPFLVFTLANPSRMASTAAAGILGGLAGSSIGNRLSGSSDSEGGAPSALAAGSGSPSALGAGSGSASTATASTSSVGADPITSTGLAPTATATPTTTTGAAATTGALPSGPGASSGASLSTPTGETTTTSGGLGSGAAGSSGGSASDAGITRVEDRMLFDAEKEYVAGTMGPDGESFQPFTPDTMSGEAIVDRGRGIQLQDSRHAGDRDLVIREAESGDLFDVSAIAERDRDMERQLAPETQSQQSRDVVFGTRQRGN